MALLGQKEVVLNFAEIVGVYKRMLKDENPKRQIKGFEGVRRLDKYLDANDASEKQHHDVCMSESSELHSEFRASA